MAHKEGQIKIYMIPELFLKPSLVKRCISILDGLDLQFRETESCLNSSLQSGMVVRISLGDLPDRNPQMRELCQIVVTHGPEAIFKFFEGIPGPGIAISHRGVTNPEWVGNVYEGDGGARDRAQELREAWGKADVEYLECVAGLQQCPDDSAIICQGSRNKQMLYAN